MLLVPGGVFKIVKAFSRSDGSPHGYFGIARHPGVSWTWSEISHSGSKFPGSRLESDEGRDRYKMLSYHRCIILLKVLIPRRIWSSSGSRICREKSQKTQNGLSWTVFEAIHLCSLSPGLRVADYIELGAQLAEGSMFLYMPVFAWSLASDGNDLLGCLVSVYTINEAGTFLGALWDEL